MAQQIVLRNSIDAWTSPTRAVSRFGDTKLYVHSTTFAYQYFTRPQFPAGTVITSAKLRLYPGGGDGTTDSVAVSLYALSASFDPNTLTWSNAPAAPSLIQNISVSGGWLGSGGPIEFDVTSKVQSIIDGGSWFGWRISSTEVDPTQYIGGSHSENPPELVIEYVAAPQAPIELRPSSNSTVRDNTPTLSWVTPGGQLSSQRAIQIQVASNSSFSSGLYQSDEITTNASSLDLSESSPAFTPLAAGNSRFWRVRIKNDTGQWSSYSAPSQFTYNPVQTLNITSPGSTSSDPTPVVTWTYAGDQEAWEMFVEEYVPLSSTYSRWVRVYGTGIQYGTSNSFELPPGVVTSDANPYRIILRVWDEGEAVAVTGAPLYSEDIQQWNWDPTGATPPVELEVSDITPGLPGKRIRWRYTGSTAPRRFFVRMIRRGKTTMKIVDANLAREGATQWYRLDEWPPGRAEITFDVSTGDVAGLSSSWAESPTVVKKIDHKFPWVSSVYDRENRIFCLLNPTVDPGLSEISDLVTPVNGVPFLAMYAFNKFNGTASGLLSDAATPGLTADQMLEDFLWIRENPRVFFMWADQSIEAYIYNTAFTPVPVADGSTDYAISFNFVQV